MSPALDSWIGDEHAEQQVGYERLEEANDGHHH